MQNTLPLAVLMLAAWSAHLIAASPQEYAVQVEAAASGSQIVLSWPFDARVTSYEVARKLRGEAAWGPVTTLPGDATGMTDSTVAVGTVYEYRVWRPPVNSALLAGFGYLSAGINVPPVVHRGTVILVVDDTMAAPLATELLRLRDDLIGDGWSVIRHDVSRSDPVATVKALIVADYAADPTGMRSVFLFGHVPVPYAGNIAYDGHGPEHQGGWTADLFYGDMDGAWTDSSVDNANAHFFPENDNIPGDGKLDQSVMPSAVELEVGRVDLANMPAFALSETELLRQYLDKDHRHRHALRVLPRRAIIDDRFGEFGGQAAAVSGWRSWTALVGAADTTSGSFSTLSSQAHLCFYLCGGGWIDSCDSVNTAAWASSDPQTAFTLLFGSWFGDWDKTNNFLRAPLATTTGLTSAWAGRPHWFLHPMALGSTIGECARLTQNNRSAEPTYLPLLVTGYTHVALMGDPTLRLVAVVPPSSLTLGENGSGQPVASWTASADASLGYHVYRSVSAAGPFNRLTSAPVAGTTWTDTSVTAGVYTYQVKAAKLETTPGGTYVNTSQAITGTIDLGGSINATPIVLAGSDQAITLPTASVSLAGSATDSDGTIAGYAWVQVSGSAHTIVSPTAATTVVNGLAQGTHVFRLTATDNLGATGFNEVQVTVGTANTPPVVLAGPNQTMLVPATSTSLSGTASDDGSVVSYGWTQVAGSAATIVSPGSPATVISDLVPGAYRFRLTATDDQGGTAWDEVTVLVRSGQSAPASASCGLGSGFTLFLLSMGLAAGLPRRRSAVRERR